MKSWMKRLLLVLVALSAIWLVNSYSKDAVAFFFMVIGGWRLATWLGDLGHRWFPDEEEVENGKDR